MLVYEDQTRLVVGMRKTSHVNSANKGMEWKTSHFKIVKLKGE